jgi:Tetratricopeptide repeat
MLCVLFVVSSGCATLDPKFPPSPPGASGIDPAVDAQILLMESAYRAYAQERYLLASALFQRFVSSNPNSPRLNEARWWLARSYEQGGDFSAAWSVYRALIEAGPRSTQLSGSYEWQALKRLDESRKSLGSSSLLERRQVALWLASMDWLTIADPERWMTQLAEAGVTAVVLDAGSLPRDGAISKFPVAKDLFRAIVRAAHAKGMAVLASLNLHEPGWTIMSPEWGIATITGQPFQPIGSVDVLHPDYQHLVSEVTQALLQTGIDGLVFGARKGKGFADEWSPTTRRMFETLFAPLSIGADRPASLTVWRWVGWKARTYLGFVARLAQQLRQTRPGLLAAVVVHEGAVFSPVDALTEYGEDVLEAREHGLHLIVQPESGIVERSNVQGSRMEAVRQRLATAAGNERRLWLSMILGTSDLSSLVTAVSGALSTAVGQAGTHLLLMNGSAIP